MTIPQIQRQKVTTAFEYPVNTRLGSRLNRGASVAAALTLEMLRVNNAERRLAESRRETLQPI